MTFLEIFLVAGVFILVYMTALWGLSLILRNSSIVDIFWGLGFVIAAWIYFALSTEGYLVRKLMICGIVTIWGLRLTLHILVRNWGKAEDYRYKQWREKAGKNWWWRSFFKVFLLQGILMWLISIPLLAAQYSPTPKFLNMLDYLAVLVWLIGFYFEAIGDWQLRRFKAEPKNKGKLLTAGVWKYTRHPNYFGDAAQWWGFYLAAAATGTRLWTIFSPILMTFLLLRVSGVKMLEVALEKSKPGYEEYIKKTNAFFPWFPRQ